jgi:hypothetical protein
MTLVILALYAKQSGPLVHVLVQPANAVMLVPANTMLVIMDVLPNSELQGTKSSMGAFIFGYLDYEVNCIKFIFS